MTEFTTVYEESKRPRNRQFYAPAFELRIAGAHLPREVLRDVVEVSYHDNLAEIDSFEITVNNWDDTHRRFKFIGSETEKDLTQSTDAALLYKLFEPCRKTVDLQLGYVDALKPMMRANFTAMEPNFPSSGAPLLTVRGLNVLHALRKKKYSNAWIGKKPSEIARSFDALRDAGQPRLRKPWRIATDKQAESRETPLEYVAQIDQYDVDFLLNFARQHGYELEAREETHELWFGPGARAHAPVNYTLEWGVSLIEFKPTLSTANQWRSVTVRGWNRRTQQPISETVDLDDPELKRLNRDLHEMVQCDPREQQVVDLPVFTPAEAKNRARAILRDRLARIVTASGRTIGLPHLKAGTRIDIRRVGARLSGTYLVTKTSHVLGEGGYTTQFECRREELGAAARPGGAA